MKELFQWVPWFGELAKKVAEGRQKGLVDRAKDVDWAGLKCAVLEQGEDMADPLTFFYQLASIAGGKAEKREAVFTSVAEVFGVQSDLDHGFDSGFILPTPPPVTVMFNNTGADPRLLWKMFDQARALDDTSDGAVGGRDTFTNMLRIKGVGVPKLTQVLFLINPRAFLPFDTAAVLPLGIGRFNKPPAKMSWVEYLEEISTVRTAFPGCECYEINIISYLWTSGTLPHESNRWYQITTRFQNGGEDEWHGFLDNNWVYPGGDGDGHWPAESEVSTERKQDHRLDEPRRGDVVLVCSERQQGRGIGIVYRNDYSERLRRNSRIHLLWVNKEQAPLVGDIPAVRFSIASQDAYEAFAKSAAYSATVDLLPPPDSPTAVHRLNQILYGPPGTGKTYSTTNLAMAIVKGIKAHEVTDEHRDEFGSLRFDPTDATGQIAMVTFHQNFSYEDFVEGIRPRLAESGDLGYELRPGIFKSIAEAARADPARRPYVLIIDEINRGNIPKILGELITLIEPSRRVGKEDETTVTLPYSGVSFGVPGNLHIIGTMNTADRSILPLDTALRRRFDHVEMMPDPDHPLIADNVAGIDLRKMLKAVNARISLLLDRERQIGHTYLFNVNDIESLSGKFRMAILPLLLEYFYDDWSKIRHVLGGAAFVVRKQDGEHASNLVEEGLLDSDTAIHEVLPETAAEWRDPVQYRRIYDETASVDGNQWEDESTDTGDDQS